MRSSSVRVSHSSQCFSSCSVFFFFTDFDQSEALMFNSHFLCFVLSLVFSTCIPCGVFVLVCAWTLPWSVFLFPGGAAGAGCQALHHAGQR